MGSGDEVVVRILNEDTQEKPADNQTFLGDNMFETGTTLGKMQEYSEYFSETSDRKYVVSGSVVGCKYGMNLTRINLQKDHAIYDENGNAVLTCSDCVAEENIYSFGICSSPKVLEKPHQIITLHRGTPNTNHAMATGPMCKLILTTEWLESGDVHTHIWNAKKNRYEKVLVKDASLTCLYGEGIITIREVNSATQGFGKEYVKLTMMRNIGWKKIHCGYLIEESGQDSPLSDKTSVIARKFREINQTDVDKINQLFNQFEINIKNRICGFFAECSAETDSGVRMLEAAGTTEHPLLGPATRANVEWWFDTYKKYKAKYRGAGAIQLTWDYHYEEFCDWLKLHFYINDLNIINLGAEYVAMTYPWEAAVFFWDKSNLNDEADAMSPIYTAGDITSITYVVNSGMSADEYQKRENAYKKWMEEYSIQ